MAHRARAPVMLTSFNKQGSLDMYLREVRSIRESFLLQPRDASQEESSENEEDPDALWLRQAGFGNLVSQLESGGMDDSGELDSRTAALPKTHAAVIRRRMNTLRSTLRSRHQNGEERGDVRHVFPSRTASPAPPHQRPILVPAHPSNSHPRASPPINHHNSHTPTGSPRGSPTPHSHSRQNSGDGGRGGVRRTPPNTLDSPQEDIKLHFGSPAHPLVPQATTVDHLPNFTVMPDLLGITHISDLSPVDMDKVRSLALLELTVTFDDHNIPLRPRRPAKAKNYPEDRLFRVPLSSLLQTDRKRDPNTQIPLLLQEMLSYLEERGLGEEGVLRVPGSSARVAALQQELEVRFNAGVVSFEGRKVSDIASLLKQFLRELPVPLLTREHLPTFASIADIDDLKEQVRTLNLLVLLLPDLHQRVLKRLLEFCERVTRHSEINKMDLTNVAMVIAPNLFVSLPYRHSLDDVAMAAKTSHVVRLLIKYHNLLWTVPGEMLKQVRFLYEAEVTRLNQRNLRRAIHQMHQHQQEQQAGGGKKMHESEHQIIRVKAPLFTRVCMAVNISDGVTAGDLVQKLQRRSRLNRDVIRKRFSSTSLECLSSEDSRSSLDVVDSPGEQFLFEVGGNIGERCLSNDTNMFAMYTVNPNAQWVIKPKDCPDLT